MIGWGRLWDLSESVNQEKEVLRMQIAPKASLSGCMRFLDECKASHSRRECKSKSSTATFWLRKTSFSCVRTSTAWTDSSTSSWKRIQHILTTKEQECTAQFG
jgi:hypothetical protein